MNSYQVKTISNLFDYSINLPRSVVENSVQCLSIIELSDVYSKQRYQLWSAGRISSSESFIELSHLVANSMGLTPNAFVSISSIIPFSEISRGNVAVSFVNSIELEPETSDDWESVKNCASEIENIALTQIKSISLSQKKLILRNRLHLPIKFNIKNILISGASPICILEAGTTELFIIPKEEKTFIDKNQNSFNYTIVFDYSLNIELPPLSILFPNEIPSTLTDADIVKVHYMNENFDLYLRVLEKSEFKLPTLPDEYVVTSEKFDVKLNHANVSISKYAPSFKAKIKDQKLQIHLDSNLKEGKDFDAKGT